MRYIGPMTLNVYYTCRHRSINNTFMDMQENDGNLNIYYYAFLGNAAKYALIIIIDKPMLSHAFCIFELLYRSPIEDLDLKAI